VGWVRVAAAALHLKVPCPSPSRTPALQPDHGYPSRYLGRSRQAALLAEVAERGAAEAGKEGGEHGQALAAQFERVRRQLEGQQ